MRWCAWFVDGSTFDSREIEWAQLPADGVAVVVVYHDDGTRRICQGNDFYWLWDGTVCHADVFDEARYPGSVVKRGKWMDDKAYGQLVETAMR